LPAHSRYEVVIRAQRLSLVGGEMHCIGEFRIKQLDIVPAQLRVRVTCRPRHACAAAARAWWPPLIERW
jgi:transposase